MATFLYRAYDGEGLRVSGARKSENEAEVKKYLEGRGLLNGSVTTSQTAFSTRAYKLVNAKELAIFCRQMSVLFFSNITLMEGLLLLKEQTGNKQLRIALGEIYEQMEQGYTFAEATGMYTHIFGSYLLNMVTIGETSGTLDAIFTEMALYFDKEHRTSKKIRSAVAYPAILTVLMGGIVVLLVLKILPMFSDLLDNMGGDLPGATRVILAVSAFINQYAWIILFIIIAIVIAMNVLINTEKGRVWWDGVKLRLPFSKFVIARVITARFARSLAILLKSGVQLLNALDEIKSLIENKYVEKKFMKTVTDVKEGKELSDALSELGILPPLFLKMVIIGQKTGHLDDMLGKSASIFDEEVDDSLERITVMIEPVLIILLSIVVGIILVSVMLPMISIMDSIG